MYDVVVVEAADHVDDGLDLSDVSEELVAKPFALGRALYQARDIAEFHDRVGGLFGIVDLVELGDPLVRHGHDAHVGLDSAERIVGGLGAGLGYGVEKGALAHVGKSHDS